VEIIKLFDAVVAEAFPTTQEELYIDYSCYYTKKTPTPTNITEPNFYTSNQTITNSYLFNENKGDSNCNGVITDLIILLSAAYQKILAQLPVLGSSFEILSII
jgi:hypothetical protein